jgi:CubicO group peptidase (beta-lactamase class C family)
MAQFLIAHVNQGRVDGYQLLEPETVALMHSRATGASGDIGMVGYGYGLNHMRTEPWQFYGHVYEFGSLGHGGSDYGYSTSMYFVEEETGGYGFILLTNASKFFKQDIAWHFEVYLKMENLLMQEARTRYLQAGQ